MEDKSLGRTIRGTRTRPLERAAPLFCNQSRCRISKRRVQDAWRGWQVEASFDRLYHAVRHSAVTNVYRSTRDLFLTQRFANVSPLTTTVYNHPGDEEIAARLRKITC